MCAIGPIELCLNCYGMFCQMVTPAFHFLAARSKTYMAWTACAVRRYGQVSRQRRLQCLFGLEEKQYAVAAPEKCVAFADFPDRNESQYVAIELDRLGDITNLERGFKDAGCAHGRGLLAIWSRPRSYQATAIFCKDTRRSMPPRASFIRLPNSSSENGAPSAVPWISTTPPLPAITKLLSVSATVSSA